MKEAHIKRVPAKTTLRFVWTMMRDYKGMLFTMVSCACVFAAFELSLPVMGKHLFDQMTRLTPGNAMEGAQIWTTLWQFFALVGAFWLFRYGMFYMWIPFSGKYMTRVVQAAFDRVQMFSSAWHNDTFAGVTVRNITRGMRALDGIAETLLTQFLPTFLIVAGSGVYMVASGYTGAGIALFCFIAVFMTVTGTISLKIISPLNQAANDMDSKIGGIIADSITCNPAVKSFGSEAGESLRLRGGLAEWQKRKQKAWYAGTSNGLLQTTLIVCMRNGFMIYGVYEWVHGRGTIGDVYFFFTITSLIAAYTRDFGSQLRNLQNNINDLDPVAAYMGMAPAIVDAPGAQPLTPKNGAIAFENVTFHYKPELPPLFSNLSLNIVPGQTIALVGRSGSGKTSFVKLVQRLYDVQGGRILIDGQDIALASQTSVHQAIALVPQEPVLFHRTLAENIAYGRPDANIEQIRAAARDAFIDDFIMTLPDQYQTLVGERGVKLSGGERQRVAIARAILANRPILVMDEATSSLDSISEALIQKALETLSKGRTSIIIAHRLSTIRKADRILVFSGGKIVEEGRHDALLAAGGTYQALYDAQIDGLIV